MEVLKTYFVSLTYFIEGCTDLPREAIGPGSNCFSRGVSTSISKET